MGIEELQMKTPESKRKKVITISADNIEEDVKNAFVDIDKDMKTVKIKGDGVDNIEGNTPKELEDSVSHAFGKDVDNIKVDWAQESKAVVAVAKQKLFEDATINTYMEDPDYKNIVQQVVADMTMNEEQIRVFQEGINATTDKAKYVEQATNKLVLAMVEETKSRIMRDAIDQNGNA